MALKTIGKGEITDCLHCLQLLNITQKVHIVLVFPNQGAKRSMSAHSPGLSDGTPCAHYGKRRSMFHSSPTRAKAPVRHAAAGMRVGETGQKHLFNGLV